MKRHIAIALLISIGADRAVAQPADAARELYERGLQHYNVGEYAQAIEAWKEAYKLSHAPLLLFNLGQAHRLGGDCPSAMRFYASYRREQPSPPNAAEVDAAEALCASSTPPDASGGPDTPSTDGGDPAPANVASAASGPGRIAAASDVGTARVMATMRTVDRGRTRRVAGIALAGTGVAGALAGGWFLASAMSASSDVEGASGEWTAELDALEARARRDQMIGLGAIGVGVACVAAGTVLYVVGRRASSLEVAPTTGGATVTLRAHF